MICSWRQANPVVIGRTLRTDDPALVNVYRHLEDLGDYLIANFSSHEGVPLKVKVSRGQSYFPNIPYAAILPPGQEVSNGIYVVICIDKSGLGLLVGCIESVTNRKGIDVKKWPIGGSIVDVDGGRPTTRYNKAFFNPREFIYPIIDAEALSRHLKESVGHAIRLIGERESQRTINIIGEAMVPDANSGEFSPKDLEDGRLKLAQLITVRRGQTKFRAMVLDAYKYTCAVTGCKVEALLEAAHILPYKGNSTNHVQNGILLRADIHLLFDLGLVAIEPNSKKVMVSQMLYGSEYWVYQNSVISLPMDTRQHPSKEALEIHRSSQFQ